MQTYQQYLFIFSMGVMRMLLLWLELKKSDVGCVIFAKAEFQIGLYIV